MDDGVNIASLERELESFCPLATYREGETIYRPRQHGTSAFLVRHGRVKLYHLDESGKRLTLAILGEGHVFGEMALAGQPFRETSADAMEEVTAWVIDEEALQRHIRHYPDLAFSLLKLFLQRMSEVQTRLKEMVFKDLETRLARTLFHLAERHGFKRLDRWEIALRITHQELAELVGSTRENVTTLLNRFAEEGLIAKERYHIDIVDPVRLGERAALPEIFSKN